MPLYVAEFEFRYNNRITRISSERRSRDAGARFQISVGALARNTNGFAGAIITKTPTAKFPKHPTATRTRQARHGAISVRCQNSTARTGSKKDPLTVMKIDQITGAIVGSVDGTFRQNRRIASVATVLQFFALLTTHDFVMVLNGRRQLRAYVRFVGPSFQISKVGDSDQIIISVEAKMKNVGQTPARNCKISIGWIKSDVTPTISFQDRACLASGTSRSRH